MARIAEVERYTKETSIEVQLNLDGSGQAQIDTGVGFFDHMLDGMARHGLSSHHRGHGHCDRSGDPESCGR